MATLAIEEMTLEQLSRNRTLDHVYLKQLARLKFFMRREKLGTVDLERFESDAQYARLILDTAEESDAEDLVSLAVELRHKRGLLAGSADTSREAPPKPNAAPAKPAPRETTRATPASAKYLFGARG